MPHAKAAAEVKLVGRCADHVVVIVGPAREELDLADIVDSIREDDRAGEPRKVARTAPDRDAAGPIGILILARLRERRDELEIVSYSEICDRLEAYTGEAAMASNWETAPEPVKLGGGG